MSRTYHHGKDRRIRVQGVRRPTDLKRLARTLIDMEYQAARVEAEAEAEHGKQQKAKQPRHQDQDDNGRGTAA